MKTSSEIKAFIIEKLEAIDPMVLYFEFFNQIEEEMNALHIKTVISRWRCACREVSKEKDWAGLDETFPQSIFCWNATLNIIDSGETEKKFRIINDSLGLDVKAIAEGKHCNIAQIIINALQRNFINKQKERLGLTNKED